MIISDRNPMIISDNNPMIISDRNTMIISDRNPMIISDTNPMIISDRNLMVILNRYPMVKSIRNPMIKSARNPITYNNPRQQRIIFCRDYLIMAGLERHFLANSKTVFLSFPPAIIAFQIKLTNLFFNAFYRQIHEPLC